MSGPDRVLPAMTGEVVLVAVVVVGSVLVVLLTLPLMEQSTDQRPIAVVDARANGSAVDICHEAGDVLPARDLSIRLTPADGAAVERPFTSGGTGEHHPDRFGAGDCRTVTPSGTPDRVRVLLRHVPSNTTLLDEQVSLAPPSARTTAVDSTHDWLSRTRRPYGGRTDEQGGRRDRQTLLPPRG